jgi:hypothetical protein
MKTTTARHRVPSARAVLLVLAITGTTVGAAALPAAAGPTGSGDTVYSTDFANPAVDAPDWGFQNGETSEYGDGYALNMEPGAFTVALDGAANLWVSPEIGDLPDDQIVETTIAADSGESSLLAGVVCRGSLDDDLGYQFLVGLDGYYTIGTIKDDGPKRLVNPKNNKRTDAIDPEGPNNVRAECTSVGTKKVRVTLFVNDEKVASAVDKTSPSKIGSDAYLITEVDKGASGLVTYSEFSITAA